MMGHKICFHEEIWLIIPKLSLLPLLIWSTDLTRVYTVCYSISLQNIIKMKNPPETPETKNELVLMIKIVKKGLV